MSLFRKLTSVVLSACLTFSAAAAGTVSVTAESEQTYETYAQETIGGSAILHCWNWSYNDIKDNLAEIAAAGYTAVQTSPVQPPKDYGATWLNITDNWWKLYQPLDLNITDGTNYQSWLGTKSELTELCTEADKYGIKVIVDIVANHLANNGSDGGTFSRLHSDVSQDMRQSEYYHNDYTSDITRYNTTQYNIGMPDLNTQHSYVQQKALQFLEDCVDCGVDGFRFDAAKHIELPTDDQSFKGDFWPIVINGVKDYASQKGKPELYIYGEILGSAGTDIQNYTQYMAVTDNTTGDHILDKTYWNAAQSMIATISSDENNDGNGKAGLTASQKVLWVESHDTYAGNASNGYFYSDDSMDHYTTRFVDDEIITRAWAVVGSRADSVSLFFARPVADYANISTASMGAASLDDNWKSTAVAEVNKFKNAFDGKSEYLSYSGNTVYNERGTKGVVISKLDGGGSVSLTAHKMADGTYTDHVTGNEFTVSGGIISGTVGSTGVAVVYNAGDVNDSEFTVASNKLYLIPGTWSKAGATFKVCLSNSNTNTELNLDMTASSVEGMYEAALSENSLWTSVKFRRISSNDGTTIWNYTPEYFLADNNDCYTIPSSLPGSWTGDVGTWSTYTSEVSEVSQASETSETSEVSQTSETSETSEVSQTSETSETPQSENLIYFVPSSYWKQYDARFVLYTFGDNGDSWTNMTKINDDLYSVAIPEGNWNGIIVWRMKPDGENRWNNSGETEPVWGQTNDLTIPTDGSNCFTVEENVWNKVNGTWSTYVPHEHAYTPSWQWADDNTSATLTLTCTCGDSYSYDSDSVTAVPESESTCTEAGITIITASVTVDGTPYSTSKSVTVAATGHSYGEPEWTWADDYSTATATFTCSVCGAERPVGANVTSKSSGISTVYTATADFYGETYTDTKTVVDYPLKTPKGFIEKEEQEGDIAYQQNNADMLYEIFEGILSHKTSIDVSDYSLLPEDNWEKLSDALLCTYPELSFLISSLRCSITTYGEYSFVSSITPVYKDDAATASQKLTAFYEKADWYLSHIDDSMDDFTKALVLHDLLVLNNYYPDPTDTVLMNSANNYDFMVNGWGVCQNYTEVYAYLLAHAGIKSEIISSESMYHAWLRICLNDSYYNVDVTWDDSLFTFYNNQDTQVDRPNKALHRFFLLGDTLIQDSSYYYNPHYDYNAYYEAAQTYDGYSTLHSMENPIFCIDGTLYTLYNSQIGIYDYMTDTFTAMYTINAAWSAQGGGYWSGNYSSIAEYGGLLYFNDSSNVWTYNPSTGIAVIHTPSNVGTLYGMYIDNGTIYGLVADSPNDKPVAHELGTCKPAVSWQWADDYSSAAATFTSVDGNTVETVNADITSVTTDATCTTEGSIVYTASAAYDGLEYRSTKTAVVPVTEHTYSSPIWSWTRVGDDYVASMKNICSVCGEAETYEAEMTSSKADGIITYTATATVDGTTYTAAKEVQESYTFTVEGGTVTKGEKDSYSYADAVTVTAEESNGENYFSGWYIGDTRITTKQSYTFYVKSDMTVTAKYEGDAVMTEQADVSVMITRTNIAASDKQKVVFALNWALPQGCTLKQAGIVRRYDSAANLALEYVDGSDIKKNNSTLKNRQGNCNFNLTVSATTKLRPIYAVAYVVYTDKNGDVQTVYSDVQTSSYQ